MLACSFLIESSSKLLVTRTGIKARMCLISGRIRLLTLELLALEWQKFYTFELEYLWSQLANLDQTSHFGVTCPWMTKILHFRTWISLKPVGQSWSNLMCSITGGEERLHIMFWGRLDQNSGVHGNRKPPLTNNGENSVSTFSRLLLIRSFLYLQGTRTCIKSRTSLNFGQIGLLTMELAALEHPIDL